MREVGDYKLAGRLASGGLGDPHLARTRDHTVVVVKSIHAQHASQLNFGRVFDLEGGSTVPFRHSRHIRVLEAARAGAEAWIAREYVAGVSLADLLRMAQVENAEVPHAALAHIGAQIAEVLKVAHDHPWFEDAPTGMLHAAISPRHIMIDWEGGLHLAGLGFGHLRQLTQTVPTVIPFLAPELVAGKEPSAPTDTYGLGAVLHAALSGKVAYRRSTPQESIAAVRDGRAGPITPTRLTIDPAVSELVALMMAQRVTARPSLGEVAAALRASTPVSEQEAQASMKALVGQLFADEMQVQLRKVEATGRSGSSTRIIVKPPDTLSEEIDMSMDDEDDVPDLAQEGDAKTTVADRPAPVSAPAQVASAPPAEAAAAPAVDEPDEEPVAAAAEEPTTEEPAPTPAVIDELPPRRPSSTADLLGSADLPMFPMSPPTVARQTGSLPAVNPLGEVESEPSASTRAPTEWSTDIPEERRPPPPGLHGPARLGRYHIRSLISRNDSAARYIARDPNMRRDVELWALDPKRLADPRLATVDWIRWFKAEVSYCARFDHPAFPAVLDAGRSEGVYFSSYVHRPLSRLAAAKASLSPRDLLEELASALATAHQHGVVLGQIDEDVVGVDTDGRVRLRPLELASEPGEGHPLLPQRHRCLAPEFIKTGQVDFTSDQFALGLLAYRVSTGRDPFPESPGIRREALLELEPAPPEGDDHEFAEIVMRLLAKEPADRFEDASALCKALGRKKLPARDAALCTAWRQISEIKRHTDNGPRAEDLAAEISKAMLLAPPAQSMATLAAAGLAFSRAVGRPVGDSELVDYWPPDLQSVLTEAIARVQADNPEPPTAPAAEVAGLAFSLAAALSPNSEGKRRKSPEEVVRALEAQRGSRWSSSAVDAAVAAIRAHHSVGEVEPPPTVPMVVLFETREALAQLLEFDGLRVRRLEQEDEALAEAAGARVVVAGVQLGRACRALDTAPAVVVIDDQDNDEPWMDDPEVQRVDATTSDEVIRAHVVRLCKTMQPSVDPG